MRRSYRLAVHRLEVRIVRIYEQGRANTLDIVLASKSFGQLVDQVEFSQRLRDQDARIAGRGQARAERSARNARPHARDEAASRGGHAHDSGADRPGAFASRQPRLAGGVALVCAPPAAGGGLAAAREPERDGGRVGLAPAVERGARRQDPGGAELRLVVHARARPRRAGSSGRSTVRWRAPSATAASKVCAACTRGSTSAWATERRSMPRRPGPSIEAASEGGYGNLIADRPRRRARNRVRPSVQLRRRKRRARFAGTGDRLRRLHGPLLRAASALRGACQRRGG